MGSNEKRSAKSVTVSQTSSRIGLTPVEAMAGTKRMLSSFHETNAGYSEEYLLTIAETLCRFSREVATAACSPIHGVPKMTSPDKPTAVDVNKWCLEEADKVARHRAYRPLKIAGKPWQPPVNQTQAEKELMKRKFAALLAYMQGRAPWDRSLLPDHCAPAQASPPSDLNDEEVL